VRTSNLNPVPADITLSSHLVLPFSVVARLSVPFATLTSVPGANNGRNTIRALLSTTAVLSGVSTCSKHGLGRRLEEIHGVLDPTILCSSCYVCHWKGSTSPTHCQRSSLQCAVHNAGEEI